MRATVVAALAIVLSGCAANTPNSWVRFDNQAIRSTPALEQKWEVDFATCRAAAVVAGNQVPTPTAAPRVSVENNVTVPVYVGPQSVLPPTPGSYNSPAVDFSPLGDIGANLGAGVRRTQTEDATMTACMAQRGYRKSR
jgi:hypothetical protein